jgi:Heterokaryon incompatibility protein (HET)
MNLVLDTSHHTDSYFNAEDIMPTMYLLDTSTLRLECFPGSSTKPKYAILSHRWGRNDEEASFQDVRNGNHLHKRGWKKIESACGVARAQGHQYLWADTCCINKVPENNPEQTDAINSMYEWYGASEVCYAYLEDVVDVNDEDLLKESQWFKRGWTLQELLAPEELIFFSQDWKISVDRFQIPGILGSAAGIEGGHASFWFIDDGTYTIDEVMSWASRRETTVPEDAAYSLIGMFKLKSSLAISYGEGGARAFVRLQELLMQGGSHTDDMTIFDWTSDANESVPRRSMFATSPKAFGENDRSIVMRIRSDIIEKCKTLMGARDLDLEDEESSEEDEPENSEEDEPESSEEDEPESSEEDEPESSEEDERSKEDEPEGSGGAMDSVLAAEKGEPEGSGGAMDSVLVAQDGLHMSVWLLELKTPCEEVGNASYEVDLGSVIVTDEYGVKKKRGNARIFVSEKNGTYYETFNLVPSFRRPGGLRFYIMLTVRLVREDNSDEIQGILLVSCENELEKHRVIMNRRIGVAHGSSNGRFSNPALTNIIIA